MTTTKTLTIGLLSFAHSHAFSYAAALSAMADVELLTTDPGPHDEGSQRGAELANELGLTYLETVQEVLDRKPDAVIIASENANHRDLTLAAISAGAHVLCEKPLATTDADATSMVDAAKAAGVYLMTAYPVRFHSAFTDLVARVRDGQLGEIISILGTNNGKMPLEHRAWFTDPELAGGGALVDHVVHVADLVDELLGERAEEVYAVSNRILRAEAGRDVETGGMVSVRYPSGVLATIDCSWSVPESVPTWGGLTLEVHGTLGSVRIDPFHAHVGGYNLDGPLRYAFGPNLDSRMIAEFLDAVRNDRPPRPDGEGGQRTLAVVTAAQRSVASGVSEKV